MSTGLPQKQQPTYRYVNTADIALFRRNLAFESSTTSRSAHEIDNSCSKNEELLLECLEQTTPLTLANISNSVSTEIDRKSHKFWDAPKSNATTPLRRPLVDDVLKQSDFTVYQTADLSDFFKETTPQRVSEICLVNDHYILVKMPETCWRQNYQTDCIIEEVNTEQALETTMKQDLLLREQCNGERVERAKFWQYHRNRKVSPMSKDTIDSIDIDDIDEVAINKSNNCWSVNASEKEIFQTRTKIKREIKISKCVNDRAINQEKDLEVQGQITYPPDKGVASDQAARENAIFGTPLKNYSIESAYADLEHENRSLKTSLHDAVILESHGFVVTPIKTLQNGRLVEIYQTCGIPNSAQSRLKVRRSFSAVRWLLKPFRTHTKTQKSKTPPKPKIHAVVYKTYFVRWKKPTDLLWQECDVQDEENGILNGLPVLKRCRSATF